MRHDTTRHTTRRDTARHDTRHDTTRHHAKWHDATRHDTTLHDTAQYDLRVLHTSRLGIKLTACPSASCFKGAEATHAKTLLPHFECDECRHPATNLRTTASFGAPICRPPPDSRLRESARAPPYTEMSLAPPPEAGAYVSPLVLGGTVVPPPSPEGGGFLGAPGLSLADTPHVPTGTGADAGAGAVAGGPDPRMPAAPTLAPSKDDLGVGQVAPSERPARPPVKQGLLEGRPAGWPRYMLHFA